MKNKVVTEQASQPKSGEEILWYIDALRLMKVTDLQGEEWNSNVAKATGCGWKKKKHFLGFAVLEQFSYST